MADPEGALTTAGLMRLWAGWRLAHFGTDHGGDGRPHADLEPVDGQSLFETIDRSGLPDRETYVVWRGPLTFAILNVFPYTSGHLMVLPRSAAATLDQLDNNTHDELWRTVRDARAALVEAFRPQGFNIGLNEGTAGGGSVPDHLHVHVVPRWNADTNFMTALAEVRILPQTLAETWERVTQAWPGSIGSST